MASHEEPMQAPTQAAEEAVDTAALMTESSPNTVNNQADSAEQSTELKRIEFVRSLSTKAVDKATGLANTAAGYAPSIVKRVATSAYETVEPYAKKAVDTVTPYADSTLVTVDNKVDSVMAAAESVYTKSRGTAVSQVDKIKSIVHDGTDRFETYAGKYFEMIDSTLKSLKGKLKEASSFDAAAQVSSRMADLRQAVLNVSQMPREKVVATFTKLQSAWEALLAHPEVEKVLEYSNKSVKDLQTRAEDVHDFIVGDPRYSGLWDVASIWLNWAQETSVGSSLKSYATPYAERLSQTKYVEAATPYAMRAIDYWKPASGPEGIKTN